jgi:hypothetical protein
VSVVSAALIRAAVVLLVIMAVTNHFREAAYAQLLSLSCGRAPTTGSVGAAQGQVGHVTEREAMGLS